MIVGSQHYLPMGELSPSYSHHQCNDHFGPLMSTQIHSVMVHLGMRDFLFVSMRYHSVCAVMFNKVSINAHYPHIKSAVSTISNFKKRPIIFQQWIEMHLVKVHGPIIYTDQLLEASGSRYGSIPGIVCILVKPQFKDMLFICIQFKPQNY